MANMKNQDHSSQPSALANKIKTTKHAAADDFELVKMIVNDSEPLRVVVLDKLKQNKDRIDAQGKVGGKTTSANKNK